MTEQQSSLEIRAVKLKRKGDEGYVPEIVVHDPELKLNRTYSDCENLCHADFTKAVGRLNYHIAFMIDKIESDDFETLDISEIIVARGFSLSGNEDELRVTLKGYQKTKRGGTFQINTPVTYLETEDENKAYFFIDDLKEKLKKIALQARKYIFEGKKAEDPQLSLDMPDGEKVTKARIAEPVTPESIVKDLMDTTNGTPPVNRERGQRGRPRKVPQSSRHPSGEVHE